MESDGELGQSKYSPSSVALVTAGLSIAWPAVMAVLIIVTGTNVLDGFFGQHTNSGFQDFILFWFALSIVVGPLSGALIGLLFAARYQGRYWLALLPTGALLVIYLVLRGIGLVF